MPETPQILPWNPAAPPRIVLLGWFRLEDRGFKHHYTGSTTHAFHLHEYEAAFRLMGVEYELQPGDITLTPSQSDSCYHLPQPGRHFCIHFEAGQEPPSSSDIALPLYLRPGPVASERIARRLVEMDRVLSGPQPDAPERHWATAAFQEILLSLPLLLKQNHPAAGEDNDIHQAVERARLWLVTHLDAPLDVPALARHIGYSQNYLAARFRKVHGCTLAAYQMQRRIEQACHLLAQTPIPVKAVGARVGLPDPQHFNKQFRRRTGLSPLAWRRKNGNTPTKSK